MSKGYSHTKETSAYIYIYIYIYKHTHTHTHADPRTPRPLQLLIHNPRKRVVVDAYSIVELVQLRATEYQRIVHGGHKGFASVKIKDEADAQRVPRLTGLGAEEELVSVQVRDALPYTHRMDKSARRNSEIDAVHATREHGG